jgi:hypothetical protein
MHVTDAGQIKFIFVVFNADAQYRMSSEFSKRLHEMQIKIHSLYTFV